jgi:C-terminal processing protease CtpA/Prc
VIRIRSNRSLRAASFLAFAAVLTADPFAGHADAPDDDPVRLGRLESLGRLWGAVKFFHPWAESAEIDWDRALIETIPRIDGAGNREEFRIAVDHMLSVLNDSVTRTVPPEGPSRDSPTPSRPPGEPVEVRIEARDVGKVAFIAVKDWGAFAGFSRPGTRPLASAFDRCAGADGIVLDLRLTSGGGMDTDAEDEGAWWLVRHLRDDLPRLLKTDLILGTARRRFHSGYPPWAGQTSGGYHSGFETDAPQSLRAAPGPAAGKRFVIVLDGNLEGIAEIAMGVQAAGIGYVVFEGDDPSVLNEGQTSAMTLAEGVEVEVRVEEAISPDGRSGFRADAVVQTDALDRAAQIALASQVPIRAGGPPTAALAPRKADEAYPTMSYPDREHRLLALFRLWNVIHYFYPYQHLMDRPWDGALGEFLPRFERARDAPEYALAVMEMVARLQDSHAYANVGTRVEAILGTASPPIRVRAIAGRTVVTLVGKGAGGARGLRVGDTLLTLDGESVEARRARYANLVAASTPQAFDWRTNSLLLQGPDGSRATIRVLGVDGKERTVKVKRVPNGVRLTDEVQAGPSRSVYRVLPEGFGYIDLVRLEPSDVDAALEAIRGTPATILDLRGYPKGTVFIIAPRLTDRRFTAAQFRRPYRIGFDESESVDYRFDQTFEPGSGWKYTGHLAVLIDERAISQSEHSCLLLESAAPGRVTFIGSPTNGTNGDITNLVLPGGIVVIFTGHDVRHADGRQLQRLGIRPDIRVEPTPGGLAAGKDEVLDRALAFLKTRLQKP